MKKIITSLIIIASIYSYAQELPEIIPPSPRAASFHIYGDIPVSHSTGVPDISIPLYTIESDGISVPIVLKYHTSSIKPGPGSDNSNIAFGWTLDVGGRISRTLNHWPDEYVQRPATFKLTDDLDTEDLDDILYLDQADGYNGPYFDTQYDIFSFETLGEHGKFIIDNVEGASNINVHELDESPKKITLNMAYNNDFPGGGNQDSIEYFKIVNGLGQTFNFGNNDNYEVANGNINWGAYLSSWLLTDIISADNSNTINFAYETFTESGTTSADKYGVSRYDQMTYMGGSHQALIQNPKSDASGVGSEDIIGQGIFYYSKTIKEITFNEGKVVFNLSADNKRINSIEIRDNNNTLIKSIDFIRTYFHPGQTTIEKLERLEINDNNGTGVQKYQFEYFDNGWLDDTKTDFWGYFNNRNNFLFNREIKNVTNTNSQTTQITRQSLSNHKDADELYCKSLVLKKIIFPTGGSTEFDYELNEFIGLTASLTSQTIKGGGLRIESITSKPGDDSIGIVKTYKYIPRDFGLRQSPKSPLNPYNYTRTSYIAELHPLENGNEFYMRYRSRTFSHGFNSNISSADTQINYENVTEYQGNFGNLSNIGKTEYIYQYVGGNVYWNLNEIDLNYSIGTVDNYNLYDLGYNKLIEYRGDGQNGKLKEINYFKNNGGTYTSVKKIVNKYLHDTKKNKFSNLNVVNICSYENFVNPNIGSPQSYYDQAFWRDGKKNFNLNSFGLPVLSSYDSSIYQSSSNLIEQKVTEIQYDGTEITSTTEYDYNDNGLVIAQTSYDSEGDTQITKTIYPEDIQTTSTLADNSVIVGGSLSSAAFNAIGDMKSTTNQTAIPIQTETYKDIDEDGLAEANELLSLQRTNFKDWGNDVVLPEFIETLKGVYNSSTNNLQERIVFQDYYSNGNLKEVKRADGTPIVYIWGYDEAYPIAKIENATYAEVSSQIAGLQTKSNNDNDRTIDVVDSNGIVTSYLGNEGQLRSSLNSLRNTSSLLSNAMVSTYTYDPLIGVTSMTGPKGYTIYYEYDDFNRLKEIKDAKGNLINDYEYHYKGQ